MGEAVRTFRNATEDIQREILAEDRPKRDARGFPNVQQSKGQADDEPQSDMGDGPLQDPTSP
jgi:Sec-independent protein translocase protein TatA